MTDPEYFSVLLDWPDSKLGGNAAKRIHWAVKKQLNSQAKETAFFETWKIKESNPGYRIPAKPMLVFFFHPPTRQKFDIDNWRFALKSAVDGICAALGIDDGIFKVSIEIIGEPVKKGKVLIQIRSWEGLSGFLGIDGGKLRDNGRIKRG